jgi:hypothetical protein
VWKRVYWGSVLTAICAVAAIALALAGHDALAIVIALESVALAILSLKETR